jgi:hypothetical protein
MDLVIALIIGATIVGALALQTVATVVETLAKRDQKRTDS